MSSAISMPDQLECDGAISVAVRIRVKNFCIVGMKVNAMLGHSCLLARGLDGE